MVLSILSLVCCSCDDASRSLFRFAQLGRGVVEERGHSSAPLSTFSRARGRFVLLGQGK
jgi:hypothetical protein